VCWLARKSETDIVGISV